MPSGQAQGPDWDALFRLAASHAGYFTTSQAAEAGYSYQLLSHHVQVGRIARVRRGIYRLVHFPKGEHEELVPYWLWSERQGAFSHRTALRLHGLLDEGDGSVDMALPAVWRRRRLKIPEGLVCHYVDVPAEKRVKVGCLPVIAGVEAVYQCAEELPLLALNEVLDRGLKGRVFGGHEVEGLIRYVLDNV